MKRQLICGFAMVGLLAGSSFAVTAMDVDQLGSLERESHPYQVSNRNNDCTTAIDVFAAGLPFDNFYPGVGPGGEWFYLSPQAADYMLCASSCHPESVFAGDSNIAIFQGTDCSDATSVYDEDAPHYPCEGGGGIYPTWYASIDETDFVFAAGTAYWIVIYDYDGIGGDLRFTVEDCTPQNFECPPDAVAAIEPDFCGDFQNTLDCGEVFCGDLIDGNDVDHFAMYVPELGGPIGGALVTLNAYGNDTPGQAAYGFGLDPIITVYAMDDYVCTTVYASDDDGGFGYDAFLEMAVLTSGFYMVEVSGYGPGPYLLTMDCNINCWENNDASTPDVLITDVDFMNYLGYDNALTFGQNGADYCNLISAGPGTFSNGHTIAALDGGERWFNVYQPGDCFEMFIEVQPAYYPQPDATCTPLIGVAQSGGLLGYFALDASEGLFPSVYNEPGTLQTTFVIDSPASCHDEVTVSIWYEDACVDATEQPVDFALAQNHPNPFNPTTTISFSLPATGAANLSVFNLAGEKVATLVDGNLDGGNHSVIFDGSMLSSGVYFYTLEANGMAQTHKMVLMK